MRRMIASMADLHCIERGDPGRPGLLLLHGAGLGARMWEPQLERLAGAYHVLAPDLPGFAGSVTAGPFTFAGAADDVTRLVRNRHGGAVSVCGLSLGAMLGLVLAAEHPGSVSALVVSGAQVRPNRLVMAVQLAMMRALPARAFVSAVVNSLPPALAAAAREDLAAAGRPALIATARSVAHADLRDALGRVRVPTLVLCGGRDRVNLPAARQVARAVDGAELRIVPGVGHLWNIEAPELFASVLLDFLGQHDGAHEP